MKNSILIALLICVTNSIMLSQRMNKLSLPKDTFLIVNNETSMIFIVFKTSKKEAVLIKKNKETNKSEILNLNPIQSSDSLRTGTFVSYYPSGYIKEIINLKNGKRDGLYYEFHNHNKISHAAFYINGVMNGKELFIYKNGNVWMENNYLNGLYHGTIKKYFYGNGKLLNEQNYKNGIRDGIQLTYFRSGNISIETPYEQGRVHGIQKIYNRCKKIIRLDYYENDYLVRQEKVK